MKARIEKKLSKKLKELLPKTMNDAWLDSREPSLLAFEQGTSVSHVWSVGGGLDYWGEATEVYTCLELMLHHYPWLGDFPFYPEGHEFEHFPDTGSFRPTGKNLIQLARDLAEVQS